MLAPSLRHAQAIHTIAVQGVAIHGNGGGVANTAPATPPAATTVTAVASPLGFLGQAAAACAVLPFGLGRGGPALSASDVRARETAARNATDDGAAAVRRAQQKKRERERERGKAEHG